MSTDLPTVSVTIQSTVAAGWITHVTGDAEGYSDIFMRDYCGYWLCGVTHGRHHGDPDLGWLAYDYVNNEDRNYTDEERHNAIQAWKAREPLPNNFYALNQDLATKAWAEGVKKDGVEWFEDGDGNTYDNAVQRAIFNGEVVYG